VGIVLVGIVLVGRVFVGKVASWAVGAGDGWRGATVSATAGRR
jgi:hypothetical protein